MELLGVDTTNKESLTNFPVYWNFRTGDEVRNLMDARVIERDVDRTRSNDSYFRDKKIRLLMKECLVRYCAYYKIYYLQGLNEILAPMLTLRRATTASSGTLSEPFFYGEVSAAVSSPLMAVESTSNDSSEGPAPLGSLSGDSGDGYQPALYVYTGSVDSSEDAFPNNAYSDDSSTSQSNETRGNNVITDNTSQLLNYIDNTFNICLTIFDKIVSRFAPILFTKSGNTLTRLT